VSNAWATQPGTCLEAQRPCQPTARGRVLLREVLAGHDAQACGLRPAITGWSARRQPNEPQTTLANYSAGIPEAGGFASLSVIRRGLGLGAHPRRYAHFGRYRLLSTARRRIDMGHRRGVSHSSRPACCHPGRQTRGRSMPLTRHRSSAGNGGLKYGARGRCWTPNCTRPRTVWPPRGASRTPAARAATATPGTRAWPRSSAWPPGTPAAGSGEPPPRCRTRPPRRTPARSRTWPPRWWPGSARKATAAAARAATTAWRPAAGAAAASGSPSPCSPRPGHLRAVRRRLPGRELSLAGAGQYRETADLARELAVSWLPEERRGRRGVRHEERQTGRPERAAGRAGRPGPYRRVCSVTARAGPCLRGCGTGLRGVARRPGAGPAGTLRPLIPGYRQLPCLW